MKSYHLCILVGLIFCGLSMELRNHQTSNNHNLFEFIFGGSRYNTNNAYGTTRTVSTAIVIVVIVIIAVGCYFCCKGVMNRSNQNGQAVYVPPDIHQRPFISQQPNNYNNGPVNNNQFVPIQNNYYPASPAPVPVRINVNQYNPYPQINDIKSNTNPYNQQSNHNHSYTLSHDLIAREKLRQPCAECNYQSKAGQSNSVMISCTKNHCYHLHCFKDMLKEQYLNGNMFKCGKCQQIYQSRIKLFCTSCLQNYTFVDIATFIINNCELDIDRLSRTYGDLCSECISMR